MGPDDPGGLGRRSRFMRPIDVAAIREVAADPSIFEAIVDPRKRIFLIAMCEYPNDTRAAAIAGVSPMAAWIWKNNSPEYQSAYAQAREVGLRNMEAEVQRRAFEGVEKGVWYQGERVGSEVDYSDSLAMFFLKGNMPDVYKDRFEGKVEGDMNIVERLSAARNRVGRAPVDETPEGGK